MFRRILVPLDGSAYSKSSTRMAIRIAKEEHAQVDGMAIIDKPDIEKSTGPVPLGGIYYAMKAEKKKLTDAESKALHLVDAFAAQCKKEGIITDLIVREGDPVAMIADEAKYHDCTILGLQNFFKYNATEDDNTLEGYLSHTAQPVIAVPENYKTIEKVLMTYDGSWPSARANQSFIQFGLWNNRDVTLFNVNENKNQSDLILDHMGKLLAAHQIKFQKIHSYGHPKDVILQYANENGFDLIVLGVNSRDTITSFLFGSTTKEILQKANIPLFLDH